VHCTALARWRPSSVDCALHAAARPPALDPALTIDGYKKDFAGGWRGRARTVL
jgi:hypothetical protein